MKKERWKHTDTYHSMEARFHRRRGGTGISTSHSVMFKLETLAFKRKEGGTA